VTLLLLITVIMTSSHRIYDTMIGYWLSEPFVMELCMLHLVNRGFVTCI